MTCRYASAFGTPGEGAHALRVGGLAAADLLATASAAFVITGYAVTKKKSPVSRRAAALAAALVFLALLVASVAVHEAVGVNTRLTAALFGRPWPGPHPRCA